MQLKFANNTVLDVLTINGGSRYFQGANRDSLEIQLARDAIAFDALEALTGDPANADKLIISDGEKQYLHEGYTLRAELSVKPVEVSPATAEAPAATAEAPVVTEEAPVVTEERLIVVLAQLSYAERELASLRDTVDALVLTGLGV